MQNELASNIVEPDHNIRPSEAKKIFEAGHDEKVRGIKNQRRGGNKHQQSNGSSPPAVADLARDQVERLQRRPSSLPKNWRLDFGNNDYTESSVLPAEFKTQKNRVVEWFSKYSEVQKNLMLSELLDMCNLPQMHLLSIRLEENLHKECPPNCKDWISWLPESIALLIFSYLDPVSLCHASRCCYSWYELCVNPYLWKSLSCRKPYVFSPALLKTIINKYTHNDTGEITWRKVFSEQYRISNNWKKGRCFIKEFSGHSEGISCVQFDDQRIVSGSFDTTIKVWNIGSNSILLAQTLTGHSKTVRCLHLSGNRLVSGSKDCTLKVWEMEKKESWSSIACRATMIGHTDTVRSVDVSGNRVISGSYDQLIKIWDIKTGACLNTLRGHSGHILCVQSDDKKIISGSADKFIKIWDYQGRCLQTLIGHKDSVACLQFDSKRIISGSFDWTIRFWDVNTGEHIRTIDWRTSEGHNRIVRCLQADEQRFLSGSDDRTIKVWDIESGERLVTLRSHGYGITCLQFSDTKIVSGSYDKRVLLWDFTV